ncbi:MAG: disulfide oxidoreductase [Acidobacteriota bacterium]|nr:disulfide oxidoreductase [Acidobacteriota bacterium]MDP2391345.1 disulfide oxidoreductase [Acidobacteriota bacterium]
MSKSAIEAPAVTPLFAVWLISLVAMLGSLFFSEVMRLPPCVLCWYQRIFMYPLVVVTTVGLLWRDPGALRYAWPLAAGGLAVAVYHNLLYYHLIPESITPCTTGVSCTDRQIEWLGFVTIPLLSLAAFTLIVATLFVCQQRLRGRLDEDQ